MNNICFIYREYVMVTSGVVSTLRNIRFFPHPPAVQMPNTLRNSRPYQCNNHVRAGQAVEHFPYVQIGQVE
jgi:hypothetical protein